VSTDSLLPFVSCPVMDTRMAFGAKSDQVLLGIVARVAAKPFVVDFQVRHRAARLTPPAIASQDLLPEIFVGRRIQAHVPRFR
jgi:hypothetical protein